MQKTDFGTAADGCEAHCYRLQNAAGMRVEILDYGAAVRSCVVPDRTGTLRDVVLGYDTLPEYENNTSYFGAVVGRCANRIAGGILSLNGRAYSLTHNEGNHHLHGGRIGFSRRVWKLRRLTKQELTLYYESPDGEEGYPGNLSAQVLYALSDDNALRIEYRAVCDCDTLCNLTNHSYFNLEGHDSGNILAQQMQLNADFFTAVGADLIPVQALVPVEGTPMDFRRPHAIGERIREKDEQLRRAGGYDHNWAVRGYDGRLREIARASAPGSGITLSMHTTLPGVQFYTGNQIPPHRGKNGAQYKPHAAFCLESQFFPNLLHPGTVPPPVLKRNTEYEQTTVYRFGTADRAD